MKQNMMMLLILLGATHFIETSSDLRCVYNEETGTVRVFAEPSEDVWLVTQNRDTYFSFRDGNDFITCTVRNDQLYVATSNALEEWQLQNDLPEIKARYLSFESRIKFLVDQYLRQLHK